MRVEIWQSRDGWRVRLIGGNGEIIVTSEAYYSKWGAKRAAKRVFPGLPHKVV